MARHDPDYSDVSSVAASVAHRRASLAVQRAVNDYVSGWLRLVAARTYGTLSASQAARLCWLMDSTVMLLDNVLGASVEHLEIAQLRRHLAELDVAVGPGSLWRYAALGDDADAHASGNQVPDLLATYDASFAGLSSDESAC